MLPRVLVTGANGFLGRHLVAELLRRGHPVRALVRPSQPPAASPLPPLHTLPIEICELDLAASPGPAALADAAAGCGAILPHWRSVEGPAGPAAVAQPAHWTHAPPAATRR